MKRKLIAISTLIFSFFFLAGIGQAQNPIPKFSLKFTGGYGTMTVGDLNTFIKSFDTYLADYAVYAGLTKGGEYKKLNLGLEFEGEIIVKLMGKFGIGLGAGYLLRSSESELSVEEPGVGKLTFLFKPDVTVFPVHLSLYYFSSLLPSTNIYFTGGVGYYSGKGKSKIRGEYEEGGTLMDWTESAGEIKDKGLGYHGGVGLEFNLGSKFAIFVEGRGRYCKLKNWEGDETYEESGGYTETNSGSMWYFEQLDPDLNKWYSSLALSDQEPSGPDIRNVRKFEADFSGFSLRAGIKIKF